MKIIWSIIGVILQVIGNTFKKSDVLFLGYYLAGTGKTRSLPVYAFDMITNDLFESGMNCDEFTIHTTYGNMIYSTIGKYWVRVENGCFIIKDRYMFYPLCNDADIHFSDCTCGYKAWAQLYRAFYFNYKYVEKLYNTRLKNFEITKKIGKYITFYLDVSRVGYEVSDEFWVNKGKPFDVYTEIPVTKI